MLAFAGGSSLLHKWEESLKVHSHEGGIHLCEAEAHHHCSLCDTLVNASLDTPIDYSSELITWDIDYQPSLLFQTTSSYTEVKRGRAPPLV
ncbi:MAG: hypothetical protein ACPGYY_05945 [Bacteroidia bacterium]